MNNENKNRQEAADTKRIVMLPIGEVVMADGLTFPAKVDGYWQGGYRLKGKRGSGIIPNAVYGVDEVHRITPAEFDALNEHEVNCLLDW